MNRKFRNRSRGAARSIPPSSLGTRSGDGPPDPDDAQFRTYRTKLKLDKEVGGGDLSELCTIRNLRFKHRGMQLGM